MNDDQQYEFVQTFADGFKTLVRKHFPKYPTTDEEALLMVRCQEKTSIYSPYNWSDG